MGEKERNLSMDKPETAPETQTGTAASDRLPEAAEFEKMDEKEQRAIEAFSAKIDVRDSRQITQYGAAAQKGMAELPETALASVKNRDLGEVGEMISELIAELRDFDAAGKQKGVLGIFTNARRSMELLRTKYEKTADTVSDITAKLDSHETTLLKDVETLTQTYDKNLEYYKLLTMYILAGKMRIARDRETTLASMREIARRTNLTQDAQAANDFENALQRFEKKLHDLEVTRVVCIQMAPQIRLLQNHDAAVADKIRSFVVNVIPCWKRQVLHALGIQNGSAAEEASGGITTAKAERKDADMDALGKSNEEFISALDELTQLGHDGAKRRAEAASELELIEADLKKKLLELQD